jgi:hypothetical protein
MLIMRITHPSTWRGWGVGVPCRIWEMDNIDFKQCSIHKNATRNRWLLSNFDLKIASNDFI